MTVANPFVSGVDRSSRWAGIGAVRRDRAQRALALASAGAKASVTHDRTAATTFVNFRPSDLTFDL